MIDVRSPRATRRRRVAAALTRVACGVMPPPLEPWAHAMQNELAYVDERDVVAWAFGCVGVAIVARLRRLYLLDVLAIRAAGALLAVFCAFDTALPTLLTVMYRLRSGSTAALGRATPGDDVERLVPLMNAIPDWLHATLAAAAACYLIAAALLLLGRRYAYVALLLGVGLHVVTTGLARPIIASVGVAAVPNPSFLAAVLLPIAFPLLFAFAAWSGGRRERVHDAG